MKCPNCGTENEENRIFCSICGVSFKEAAARPPGESAAKGGAGEKGTAEDGVLDDRAHGERAPKNVKGRFVMAGAALVLALAAAFFFIPGILQNRSVHLVNEEMRLSLDHPARWAETKNDAIGVDLMTKDAAVKIRDVTEPVLKRMREEGAGLEDALEYAVTRYAGYDAAASAKESRRVQLKTAAGIFADYGFSIAGRQVSGTVRQYENRIVTLSLEGARQKKEETDYSAIAE